MRVFEKDSAINESSDEEQHENNVKKKDDVMVGRNLYLKDLASFVYQAARGMQHLASKKVSIVFFLFFSSLKP